MTWDKDIKFPEKKVDDTWKDQIRKDLPNMDSVSSAQSKPKTSPPVQQPQKKNVTSKAFINLLSSLGYQALFHLGEIPSPENPVPEVNLEASKEMIELIVALKEKTEGNLSREESDLVQSLLADLQMKFAQKV